MWEDFSLSASCIHAQSSFFPPQLPPLQISMENDDVKRNINMIWIQELSALGIEMEECKSEGVKDRPPGFESQLGHLRAG